MALHQLSEEDAEHNKLADILHRTKTAVDEWLYGRVEKTEEEERMDAIENEILQLRGVEAEEIDDSKLVWVDRARFQLAMSAVIILNTIVIGLETDLDTASPRRGGIWIALECIFILIFIGEIVLKCIYHGPRWMVSEIMNMFITLVAFLAFIDLIVLYPMRVAGVIDFSGVLRMVSLLRIVGLLRLARIMRMYRSLEELRLVIQGLIDSCQTIAWVVILLAWFLYVCALICTKVVGQNVDVYENYRKLSGGWDHEEHFGTVGRSMYTLLQIMTLDSWSSKVARHVIANQWYMSIFFLIFLLLSTYGLLNIVVSVIVEHTLSAAQSNEARLKVIEERSRKAELEGSIREIFDMCCKNTKGVDTKDLQLSQEQFLAASERHEVREKLRQLELPREDAARLFGVIDGDGSRPLRVDEFVSGCDKLKGVAESRDLLRIHAEADALSDQMGNLHKSLQDSEKMMADLDEVTTLITRRFSSAVRGTQAKIAHSKGGAEPVVPPKRARPGLQEEVDLSIGNRPALPQFPNLLG
eukprot:TRINITY_DN11149_c0_g1_i1.p1 TRINITY_DN11149_c0_g1~~TRINITY_DN11149_c0_g1_i1.p1  ORF type:complete len:527 (-),score=119.42 TRINITY_DN11149_c0_g1_i1:163-1743(-)